MCPITARHAYPRSGPQLCHEPVDAGGSEQARGGGDLVITTGRHHVWHVLLLQPRAQTGVLAVGLVGGKPPERHPPRRSPVPTSAGLAAASWRTPRRPGSPPPDTGAGRSSRTPAHTTPGRLPAVAWFPSRCTCRRSRSRRPRSGTPCVAATATMTLALPEPAYGARRRSTSCTWPTSAFPPRVRQARHRRRHLVRR
jgi:hypothetical protein